MRRAVVVVALLAIAVVAARFPARDVDAEARGTPTEVLPALRAVGLDGSGVPPEAYRGRLLVLNVWAPWCAPCRREMPSLGRLHTRLDPARFQVAALAADEDRVAVAEYVTQRALPFPAWATPSRSETLAELAIDRIPTTLIVAPDGRVLARIVGPREWDAPTIVAELEAMAEEASRAVTNASGARMAMGKGHGR